MSHSLEEEDAGLKDLVTRTLSENGALGKIQAQLRASVFLALEDEFREKDVPLCNPRTKELLQTPAGSLAASLVHEFFTCLGLDFSLAVYGPESNLGAKLWDLHTRECLLKAMGLGEDDEPMTPLLLRLCARRAVGSAYGTIPVQTKPLHEMGRKTAPASSNANKTTKSDSFRVVTSSASSMESRNSLSVNDNNKVPGAVSTNGPGVSGNSSSTSPNGAKVSNSTAVKDGSRKPGVSSNAAADNLSLNTNPSKSKNSNTSSSNNNINSTIASPASVKESSTSEKDNKSTKPNPSRRVSPPDDILSAAPPDTDSSEASLSVDDVAGLLQDNRLGIKIGVTGDKEQNEEKGKTLSDGDYEDDFSEDSSRSTDTATYDEDLSTSSWGHPPPPLTNKSNKVNILKTDASEPKDSSKELGNNRKESSTNLKNVDFSNRGSSVPRQRSLDLLDDDVSIGEFISSEESSSAREETEDIAYNEKQDSTLDYEEKL